MLTRQLRHLRQLFLLQGGVNGFHEIHHTAVGHLGTHGRYDVLLFQPVALGIGQVALQRASRRHVDAVVLIAHYHHQSFVAIADAVLVADILCHAEGVVVLNVVDNNDDRLDAQFFFKLLERDVHAVYCSLSQHTVGIGNILCSVLQIGDGNVLRIPIDCLRRGSIAIHQGTGSRSAFVSRHVSSAAYHCQKNADDESPSPDFAPTEPFWVGQLVVVEQLAALTHVFTFQHIVLLRVLTTQT